jgi:hypothetical protein
MPPTFQRCSYNVHCDETHGAHHETPKTLGKALEAIHPGMGTQQNRLEPPRKHRSLYIHCKWGAPRDTQETRNPQQPQKP